ncbi:MAG: acyl-CoA thioesterase [Acidimicrobiia bacterium]|nr:acyl-CoA thioesterase [Acidimicrobiia bacterium]
MTGPRSTSRLRVRYAETDQMGVVYYANYFVWFEVARTDLLRRAGWTYRDMEEAGFTLPAIEAHCEYLESARYDDELDVHAAGALVSPIRVRFEYRVTRAADGAVLAEGHTEHATLDATGRPRRLPARAREMFAAADVEGEPE